MASERAEAIQKLEPRVRVDTSMLGRWFTVKSKAWLFLSSALALIGRVYRVIWTVQCMRYQSWLFLERRSD